MTTEEIGTDSTVINAEGEQIPLIFHRTSHGKETLAVYLAPDGNNDDVLEPLKKKAFTWSDNIQADGKQPIPPFLSHLNIHYQRLY